MGVFKWSVIQEFLIQWGFEIWTSLDFKWSKRGWIVNGPDFEWDLKSRSPTIWNQNKWPPFCQKLFFWDHLILQPRASLSSFAMWGPAFLDEWLCAGHVHMLKLLPKWALCTHIASKSTTTTAIQRPEFLRQSKTYLKSGPKCPDFEWSDFRSPLYIQYSGYPKTRHTNNRTIQITDFYQSVIQAMAWITFCLLFRSWLE